MRNSDQGLIIASHRSGLCEYILIVKPDAQTNTKILQEKEAFHHQYNHEAAIKSPSHITVASFYARENMESTIIRYFQRICSLQKGFEVALNNYSGFPPDTIYLRVQNQQPFKQLGKELAAVNDYISSASCPPLKPVTIAHISIARRLPERLYLEALMDFGQKSFYETFTVKELVLVRRNSQDDGWKPVNVFGLHPSEKILYN